MKLVRQMSKVPHQSSAVVQADYKGSDWFGQLKFGSFAQWGFNYMQSITKSLSLGLDYTYLGRPPFNNPPMAVQSGVLRYVAERFIFTGQVVTNGTLQASYVQRVRDNLTFGADLNISAGEGSSSCAVGYEYSTGVGSFKTNLSTDGKVTSCLEKPMSENTMVTLVAELDHVKPALKFGLGFQLMT
jgi:mitochondrial import receptor subunit TOM40